MSSTFELDKVPSTIITQTLTRRRPESKDKDGQMVRKLKIRFAATEDSTWRKLDIIHVNARQTSQIIAATMSPGFEAGTKKKLGVVSIKIHNAQGKLIVEDPIARAGQSHLKHGDNGVGSYFTIPVEMVIPRAKYGELDEYFQADTLTSIATAQEALPLNDPGERKKGNDGKPKKAKAPPKAGKTRVMLRAVGDAGDIA
jgi:hypothetical protein